MLHRGIVGNGFVPHGTVLTDFALHVVPRNQVSNPDCLFDQSPGNLWAWYNEVKDDPCTNKDFKVEFLEGLMGRVMGESK